MKVLKGIIKMWNPNGYGAIVGQDGVEYYTTLKQMVEGDVPVGGWCVEFNPWTGGKGPIAINVKRAIQDLGKSDICQECQNPVCSKDCGGKGPDLVDHTKSITVS